MSNVGNFPAGRGLLMGSPFRSVNFLIASVVAAGAVVVDVYLLYRHWQTLTAYTVMILSALIGVQLIYQWWRVLRCYGRIQELYSKASDEGVNEGANLDAAVRVATGGMTDVLFFSYGIALSALILVGVLLTRLDGLR